MVDREQLKQALVHPRRSVRGFASEYFEDGWDRGEDLLPPVLEACERYGAEKNVSVLAHAADLAVSEESLPALLRQLRIVRDSSAILYLNKIVAHAPVPLLAAHEAEICRGVGVSSTTARQIKRRLELSPLTGEELWERLQRFSVESENALYVGEIDRSYADDLIMALADQRFPNAPVISSALASPAVEGKWLEIFLVELAGLRNAREAIPALVAKFRTDTDFLLERSSAALARIGDPEAARLIRQTFADEGESFRLYISGTLGKIKHPESEEAILALLKTEEDPTIRTNLCFGLCLLFSRRGIEVVRNEIADGYDEGLLSLEEVLLDVGAIVGISFPEEEEWRTQRGRNDRRGAFGPVEADQAMGRLKVLDPWEVESDEDMEDDVEDEIEDDLEDNFEEDLKNEAEDAARAGAPSRVADDVPDNRSEVPFRRAEPKIGRNAPCPCGSGKKYKKCCGKKDG